MAVLLISRSEESQKTCTDQAVRGCEHAAKAICAQGYNPHVSASRASNQLPAKLHPFMHANKIPLLEIGVFCSFRTTWVLDNSISISTRRGVEIRPQNSGCEAAKSACLMLKSQLPFTKLITQIHGKANRGVQNGRLQATSSPARLIA